MHTFCEVAEKSVDMVSSAAVRNIMEGVIFSPNNDSESFWNERSSQYCDVNITTRIKGRDNSLTTFQLKHSADVGSPSLCLLDMIGGNRMVDNDCQEAKVLSGLNGITLKLVKLPQPRPTFNISYKGMSFKNSSGRVFDKAGDVITLHYD